jgi:hypothetical protein
VLETNTCRLAAACLRRQFLAVFVHVLLRLLQISSDFALMGLSTLQPLAYAVAYVSFFFGIISTVLRFYSRHFILKTVGWDDYIAIGILVW